MAEFTQEHKRLPVSDTRDRSFFDGMPVSLYRTTPAGQFLDVNLAMVAMMGYRHRSAYRVVLFNNDHEADFDDEYAEYLDLKAQGHNPTWPLDRDC